MEDEKELFVITLVNHQAVCLMLTPEMVDDIMQKIICQHFIILTLSSGRKQLINCDKIIGMVAEVDV